MGNFVQKHAESIATVHRTTALYITGTTDQKEDFSIEDQLINGVETVVVYYRVEKNSIVTKWKAFNFGLQYLRKNDRFSFDLVHFNVIWNAGWQAWWMKKRYGLPYLISENYTGFDTTSRSDQPRGLKAFARIITRNASFVCPVTQNLQNVMQRFGLKGHYHIVPNVVNTALFRLQPKPTSPLRFLHVSTLNDAHKNISGMLRCWKICSDQMPNIHLNIGGDGPVDHFKKMANDLGIRNESISFFGEKTAAQVAELMLQSHCLLMFSNYENLPLVIVEALSSGMAIISTDAGGIAEHIDHSLGIVIHKRDEQGLVNAITDYSKNPSRFQPEVLRDYAVKHFGVASVASQFNSLYQQMVGN